MRLGRGRLLSGRLHWTGKLCRRDGMEGSSAFFYFLIAVDLIFYRPISVDMVMIRIKLAFLLVIPVSSIIDATLTSIIEIAEVSAAEKSKAKNAIEKKTAVWHQFKDHSTDLAFELAFSFGSGAGHF